MLLKKIQWQKQEALLKNCFDLALPNDDKNGHSANGYLVE
jgi:hypothetical protein